MTAQPIESSTPRMWTPDPMRQRLANYTIEDVLALPDDAPRVELRDGVMIVVPSPTLDHQNTANLIWLWLRQHAPDPLQAVTAVGVAVDLGSTLEPDVILTTGRAHGGSHYVPAEEVVIVVEVVSPGTRRRDRFEKPADYAGAGIPYYWRVEQGPVHVYAYELAADGTYELAGDADKELVLSRPFEIRLPIGDITP